MHTFIRLVWIGLLWPMVQAAYSQDTIAGWTFPVQNIEESVFADKGLDINSQNRLSFVVDAAGTTGNIILVTGAIAPAENFAAASNGWQNGAGIKYWMIDCKAPGYSNFKLYSKQSSESLKPGPEKFLVQYALGDDIYPTWSDIPEGVVACSEDWTTGVINGLSLPDECNNLDQPLRIRWLMESNNATSGGTVSEGGISMIDDIYLIASESQSVEASISPPACRVFPSPCSGVLVVTSGQIIDKVDIFDLNGRKVFESYPGQTEKTLDLSGLTDRGLLFIAVSLQGFDIPFCSKILMVQP